jgi:hypothetical protein
MQRPLLGVPTIGVSSRRLVNFVIVRLSGWCARKTRGFMLVQAECPNVQFEPLVRLH